MLKVKNKQYSPFWHSPYPHWSLRPGLVLIPLGWWLGELSFPYISCVLRQVQEGEEISVDPVIYGTAEFGDWWGEDCVYVYFFFTIVCTLYLKKIKINTTPDFTAHSLLQSTLGQNTILYYTNLFSYIIAAIKTQYLCSKNCRWTKLLITIWFRRQVNTLLGCRADYQRWQFFHITISNSRNISYCNMQWNSTFSPHLIIGIVK